MADKPVVRKPKFTIKTGDLAGSYELVWPPTMGEWEVIWDIAGVGVAEFDVHLERGNPKLFRALLTLALTKAGRVVEPAMLAVLGDDDLDVDWPEPEPETKADGSPLAKTSDSDEPERQNESAGPNGQTSDASSAPSPESLTALASGNPGSLLSSISDRRTSPA